MKIWIHAEKPQETLIMFSSSVTQNGAVQAQPCNNYNPDKTLVATFLTRVLQQGSPLLSEARMRTQSEFRTRRVNNFTAYFADLLANDYILWRRPFLFSTTRGIGKSHGTLEWWDYVICVNNGTAASWLGRRLEERRILDQMVNSCSHQVEHGSLDVVVIMLWFCD